VWHFAHGWPVFFAISELAIVCREATIIIATAINITVAVPTAADTIALIVFGFCIVDLLSIVRGRTSGYVNCHLWGHEQTKPRTPYSFLQVKEVGIIGLTKAPGLRLRIV
jgi:hypothetical protein